MRGGFVIQRHNGLRDLEAELLDMVCKDVAIEPIFQDAEGDQLTRGSNKARDSKLDIHVRAGARACISSCAYRPVHVSCQPFSMSRFVTRMLNSIWTSSRSKYIVYTRMRKSVNNQVKCLISNMEHLRL